MLKAPKLYWRNPLAYPGGVAPGVDGSHPIAAGAVLSSVATNGTYYDLVNKKIGVRSGSPVATVDGIVGPGVSLSGTQNISFTGGIPAGSYATWSLATIFRLTTAPAASNVIFLGDIVTTSTPFTIYVNVSSQLLIGNWIGGNTALIISTGIPYFLFAARVPGTTQTWSVIENLATGQMTFNATGDSGAATLANNNYSLGGTPGGSRAFGGNLSSFMFSANAPSSKAEMLRLASDPWAFWFKHRTTDFVGINSGGGGFTPLFRKTLSMYGSGVGKRQSQAA